MLCVYNQAVRVAIGVDVRVIDTEEEGVKGVVYLKVFQDL
jgi:hypothetical protein